MTRARSCLLWLSIVSLLVLISVPSAAQLRSMDRDPAPAPATRLDVPDEEELDDGTGLSLGRGLDLMNAVLGTTWNKAYYQHRDYVEDFGIDECVGCHNPEAQGYDNDFASGCLTCHGPEFCGEPGSEGLSICASDVDDDDFVPPVLSQGNLIMNLALGVEWNNPLEQHQDFVKQMGVEDCTGCHDLDMGGKAGPNTFDAPGCLSCHGPEFCGLPGAEDAESCMDDDSDDDSWDY